MAAAVDLLVPRPRRITPLDGDLLLAEGCRTVCTTAAVDAGEALRRGLSALGLRPHPGGFEIGPGQAQLRLAVDGQEPLGPQGYRLTLDSNGIDLVAGGPAGLFYGATTLTQWLRLAGESAEGGWLAPAVEIADAPDFPVRGFLLDVSRNRVPRLDALFELVELLAGLKINQLQLYTEHTFAYSGHDVVWRDASPLTARDIRELDVFCRKRFVELVPNQNSLGHFHRWLVHEPYRDLAECPEGLEHPFSRSREPFSLCPTDPRSFELLEDLFIDPEGALPLDLFEQLLPNFASRMVNVGLDEAFDLGRGRSAGACSAHGTEEVYLEFLSRVHGLVSSWGHRMQFWGDIILERPDLIERLPRDVIALDWGYEADHPFERETRAFAEAGLDFYVCPGTSSWRSLGGRIDNALENLARAAIEGRSSGAIGYLVTDWGDLGHLQPLPISYPGIVAGAAFGWNCTQAEAPGSFPLRDLLATHVPELGDAALVSALLTLGRAHLETGVQLKNSTVLFHLLIGAEETLENERYDRLSRAGLERTVALLDTIDLPRGERARSLATRELRWVTQMLRFACELGIARLAAGRDQLISALPPSERADLEAALAPLIVEFPELWLGRSRPGGLEASLDQLARIGKLLRR